MSGQYEMTPPQLTYSAYLVRIWRDSIDSDWRASAQSVQSGVVTPFGSLQALFDYLETAAQKAEEGDQ